MRVPTNLARGSVGFNMTPMIDVVFLLIIFFLVSSHLARQEVQLELDLPRATTARRAEEDDVRRVVLNVLPETQAKGRVMVGGKLTDTDQLTRLLKYESRQSGGRLEVRIRTDRKIPYRRISPILTACGRAEVWQVTFAVMPGK